MGWIIFFLILIALLYQFGVLVGLIMFIVVLALIAWGFIWFLGKALESGWPETPMEILKETELELERYNKINSLKKTGQVIMKAYPNPDGKISFHATAKMMAIDWGDGKLDVIVPNGVARVIIHQYPNSDFQTILINAENLTYIEGLSDGVAHELRFVDCPNLETIDFSLNKLTVLSIKKASALHFVGCIGNQLTAETLIILFQSLPDRSLTKRGGILIYGNPGADTCNRSIASSKGWNILY